MKMQGIVHRFGDNINTDVIIPARYLNTSEPSELAAHCMEDADPSFVSAVRPGDIIVGGANFGCGSSREHAPIAIKAAGVSCVVAVSYARIFYRNAINIGLPILECPEAAAEAESGDRLEIIPETGEIRNMTKGRAYSAVPFPPFIMDVIRSGGLLTHIKNGG